MKTLFLDFDGVLFDSVKEAYLLSRSAYANISPLEPIDKTEYTIFHKYRYLITKSWHFYYIYELIKKHVVDFDFEKKYKNLVVNGNKEKAEIFDKKYVTARENLIRENYNFWDSLDEPYPFFFKIKELTKDNNYKIIILTNKKKLPVLNKLKKYNLKAELFANEDLINYANKSQFISNYMTKNSISNAFFIEDSIENLKACEKNKDIRGLLVNWGYLSPKEKGLSLEEVIKEIGV